MEIRYRNRNGKYITNQQATNLVFYIKEYFIDKIIVKQEKFFEGKLFTLDYYNYTNENHQMIFASNIQPEYNGISIIEKSIYDVYTLEESYNYDENGILLSTTNSLYDSNHNEIGFEFIDASLGIDYSLTKKYYWDKTENPDRELFECTYFEGTGELEQLYYNNEHINNSGQDSFVLTNTPEDIQELIGLTGMSLELVEYYMNSNVIPNL